MKLKTKQPKMNTQVVNNKEKVNRGFIQGDRMLRERKLNNPGEAEATRTAQHGPVSI